MIKKILGSPLTGEAARFLMTGGLNTVLTIALYQLLVSFVNPSLSYAIAWIAGFIFVAITYPKFVFRSDSTSLRQSMALFYVYLVSFLVGIFLTWMFVRGGGNERFSIFVVIAITSTINFIAGKFLYGNIKDE